MRVLPGPTKSNQVLLWSPDGRFVAAGGIGDGIMVWDVGAGTPGRRLMLSAHGGQAMQFCQASGRLYVAFQVGGLWYWEPATDEVGPQGRAPEYAALYSFALSADGGTAVIHARFRMIFGGPASPKPRRLTGYSLDGKSGIREVWRIENAKWSETHGFTFRPHSGELFGLGRHLDGALRFEWMRPEASEVAGSFLVPPECGGVKHWALSPDGERVAWITEHGLFLQRLDDPTPLQLPEAASEYRSRLAWSPDGRTLAYTAGTAVRLLDADTLSEVRAFDWNTGNLRAVAFSPDGLRCAVSGDSGRGWVTVFDLD